MARGGSVVSAPINCAWHSSEDAQSTAGYTHCMEGKAHRRQTAGHALRSAATISCDLRTTRTALGRSAGLGWYAIALPYSTRSRWR